MLIAARNSQEPMGRLKAPDRMLVLGHDPGPGGLLVGAEPADSRPGSRITAGLVSDGGFAGAGQLPLPADEEVETALRRPCRGV
jgi:hypothetical protein